MKRLACLLLACLAAPPAAQAKDFLRTQGTQIVDEAGKPVILRGMGLGGWMLQEGYMLDIDGVGTQHSIHARIAELIGTEKADAFSKPGATTTPPRPTSMRWGAGVSTRCACRCITRCIPRR